LSAEDALKINTLSVTQNNHGKGHRMTMVHQEAFPTTLNRGEAATPIPTTPTEEIIIRGYDELETSQAARSIVGLEQNTQDIESRDKESNLLDHMFDEYVAILQNPQSEYNYDTGEKTVKRFVEDENGDTQVIDEQPVYRTISKQDILNTKREELSLYTRGTLPEEMTSTLDSSLSVEEWQETADSIDETVELLVKQSIERALARAGAAATTEFSQDSEASEEAKKFTDILKNAYGLGAVALHSIQSSVPMVSGAIDLVAQKRPKSKKKKSK